MSQLEHFLSTAVLMVLFLWMWKRLVVTTSMNPSPATAPASDNDHDHTVIDTSDCDFPLHSRKPIKKMADVDDASTCRQHCDKDADVCEFNANQKTCQLYKLRYNTAPVCWGGSTDRNGRISNGNHRDVQTFVRRSALSKKRMDHLKKWPGVRPILPLKNTAHYPLDSQADVERELPFQRECHAVNCTAITYHPSSRLVKMFSSPNASKSNMTIPVVADSQSNMYTLNPHLKPTVFQKRQGKIMPSKTVNNVPSEAECLDHCANTPTCRAATYDFASQTCLTSNAVDLDTSPESQTYATFIKS